MGELEVVLQSLGIIPMSIFSGDDDPPQIVFVHNHQILGLDEVKNLLTQAEIQQLAAA